MMHPEKKKNIICCLESDSNSRIRGLPNGVFSKLPDQITLSMTISVAGTAIGDSDRLV